MKKILRNNKGITLIALVITIVILIILAGVLISLTLGENGIFTRSKLAKQKYEYASAKETIELKLVEIQTKCLADGIDYTIEYIADEMGLSTEEAIDVMYYYETVAKVNANANSKPSSVQGLVVIANSHPMFEFLIGEKSDGSIGIKGVKETEEGTPVLTAFKDSKTFENDSFGGNINEGGQSGQGSGNGQNQTLIAKNSFDATVLNENESILAGTINGKVYNYTATGGLVGKIHPYAVDGDGETSIAMPNVGGNSGYIEYYLPSIDLTGKKFKISVSRSYVEYCFVTLKAVNSNNEETSMGSISEGSESYTIPENTEKIRIYMQRNSFISEMGIKIPAPEIVEAKIAYLTDTTVQILNNDNSDSSYVFKVEADNTYSDTYYRINNGEWQKYTKGTTISANLGQTLKVKTKGFFGTEEIVQKDIPSNKPQLLPMEVFQQGVSTDGKMAGVDASYYLGVDQSLWNKKIKVNWHRFSGEYCFAGIRVINEEGKSDLIGATADINTKVVIPEGTKYLELWMQRNVQIDNIYPVKPVSAPTTALVLYNEGDKCTSVTGGWSQAGEQGHTSYSVDNGTYLSCGSSSGAAGHGSGWYTNNKIDTTGYEYLCLQYSFPNGESDYRWLTIATSIQASNGYWNNVSAGTTFTNDTFPYSNGNENIARLELDTSEDRWGEFYVWIATRRTLNIKKVWLQPY